MNLPKHNVIIPDGNRRWAKQKGLAAFWGHEAGAKKLEEVLRVALDLKIPHFTFWGSSLDNVTKRPKEEVEFLFGVFRKNLEKLLSDKKIDEEQVKISVLGRWEELFPESLRDLMRRVIQKTKNYEKYHLTFLMAYSGLDEIKNAVAQITDYKSQNPNAVIDERLIKNNLWTRELPPVDLVIRTGGEPHLSQGLMMWDVADAQLYFTETLWPDFEREEFKKAIETYSKTDRRFGK